jgi:hypothetical protein
MVAAACAAVVGGCMLGSCGGSPGSTHPAASPDPLAIRSSVGWLNQPPGKAAGDQVARELVSAVPLPPGSQRLTKSPTPVLDKPLTTVPDDNFLDHNAWWKVNLSTKDLLSYLRAHPLKGLVLRVTGSGVDGFNQPMVFELQFDPAHPLGGNPDQRGGNPDLDFNIVSGGNRASWLRIDGQTIWYPARPVDETAPTTGTVNISLTSGATRTVTDPAAVSRLATEFNRLLRTTPGQSGGVACTANEQTISSSFTKPGETTPTITASLSGCSIDWAIRGPSGDLPGLQDGGDLLTDALRLLGVSPNALHVPAPTPIPSSGPA